MIGNPAAYELLHLPVGSNVSRDAPDEDRPGYKVFKSGRELSNQELPLQRAIAGEIVQDFEFELLARCKVTAFYPHLAWEKP